MVLCTTTVTSIDNSYYFHINIIHDVLCVCCDDLHVLLAIINVQPFRKSAARYPSNDPIFFILLSLTFTIIGTDIMSRENRFFHYIWYVDNADIISSCSHKLHRRVKRIHQLINR